MEFTPRKIRKIQGTIDPHTLAVDLPALADEIDAALGEVESMAGAIIAPASLNANSIDEDIRYSVSSSTGASNLPPGQSSGLLATSLLLSTGSRPKLQTFIGAVSSPSMWTRFSGTSGWSTWQRLDGVAKLNIGGFLGTTGDLNDATEPGTYGYWSSTQNRPGALSGTVWVAAVHNSTTRVQLAVEHGNTGGLYSRFSGSTGWSAWKRLDAGAVPPVGRPAPPSSPAGFRTVPLALTAGGGAASDSTSGIRRMPLKFARRITRWRLHLRNINPRFGTDGAAVAVSAVFFGAAANGAYAAAPAQIASSLSTGTDGAVTPWQDTPLEAGVEYALSYAFSTAGSTNRVVGGGWSSTHVSSTSATLTRVTSLPLDAWIEAEVAPDVPVIAAFGDSLSAGVGSTLPVYDSAVSQLCRRLGALPVHYAASGDTMEGWSDATAFKWSRWGHLSRPDVVIHAMGSNDVFGGADLAALQARRAATAAIIAATLTPVIVSTTILPRTGDTSAAEGVRRAYNTWLKTRPDAARDCFDIVAAVSPDDETLTPALDADGTHLTTGGYAAVQAAMTRPLVPRTGWVDVDISNTAGSIRDPANPGALQLRRDGNRVTARMWGVGLTAASGQGFLFANNLPAGYRSMDITGSAVSAELGSNGSVANRHRVHVSTDDIYWCGWSNSSGTYSTTRAAGTVLQGEMTWITDDPAPV